MLYGIGDQRLDVGDAQPARAPLGGRARLGRGHGPRAVARLVEPACPGRRRMRFQPRPLPGQERLQPHQPARRHRGRPVAAARAGEHRHGRAAGGEQEVVRGMADRRLRARQPGGAAHRPAEPRPRVHGGRPDTLHEPAEHRDVHRLQAGLQQAPDEDARMLGRRPPAAQGAAAAHHCPFQQRVEQAGQRLRRRVGQVAQRRQRVGEQGRQRLALLQRPQPRRTGLGIGCRQRLAGRDQRRQRVGRRRAHAREHPEQRRKAIAQTAQKVGDLRRLGDEALQPVEPRRRARPAQGGALQRPRRGAAGGRRQPRRGQRMLQQRQQRHRRERLRHRPRQQAQERRRRRLGQFLARAVVGDHAPAQQLRCHPAGERAVGRDQRRAPAGRLQRIAQDQRDRRRLLLLVRGIEPEQPARVRRQLHPPRAEPPRRQQRRRQGARPALGHRAFAVPGGHVPPVGAEIGEQGAQRRLRMRLVQPLPVRRRHRRVEARAAPRSLGAGARCRAAGRRPPAPRR